MMGPDPIRPRGRSREGWRARGRGLRVTGRGLRVTGRSRGLAQLLRQGPKLSEESFLQVPGAWLMSTSVD